MTPPAGKLPPESRAGLRAAIAGGLLALALAALAWFAIMPRAADHAVPRGLEGPQPRAIFTADSAAGLARRFDGAGLRWPPENRTIPPVIVDRLPADMARLGPEERRNLFLRIVLVPAVLTNERIRRERAFIERAMERGLPRRDTATRRALEIIAERYNVTLEANASTLRRTLLERVDIVPEALVLAAATSESAWGISRFAVDTNALFGEWTGRGSTNMTRTPDYETPMASVETFIHSLNTAPAFADFRQRRADLRAAGMAPDSVLLVDGLAPWSPRGADFVRDLRNLIELHQLDRSH